MYTGESKRQARAGQRHKSMPHIKVLALLAAVGGMEVGAFLSRPVPVPPPARHHCLGAQRLAGQRDRRGSFPGVGQCPKAGKQRGAAARSAESEWWEVSVAGRDFAACG